MPKVKTVYIAEGGKQFDTHKEAALYEAEQGFIKNYIPNGVKMTYTNYRDETVETTPEDMVRWVRRNRLLIQQLFADDDAAQGAS